MRQVFPQPPMVAFRRVKNNKDILHVVHKKYNNIIYNKPNKCEPCGENCALCKHIRDRPFNLKGGGGLWFFVSFRTFFSENTRVGIFFFCHEKRKFFFQNLTLDYIFFLHQNQNLFFSNIGNQNIFLEKNHNPPV